MAGLEKRPIEGPVHPTVLHPGASRNPGNMLGKLARQRDWCVGRGVGLSCQEPVTSKRRTAGGRARTRLKEVAVREGWERGLVQPRLGWRQSSFSDKDLGPSASEQLEGPQGWKQLPQLHQPHFR